MFTIHVRYEIKLSSLDNEIKYYIQSIEILLFQNTELDKE